MVNFTEIQLAIYEKCPHDELTIIMRRYMMKIAEAFARQDKCLGLITGESIGQVASQTMHSLAVTNEVCTMPVFRPDVYKRQHLLRVHLPSTMRSGRRCSVLRFRCDSEMMSMPFGISSCL